jgi:glutamate--cysteine ligase
VTLDRAKSELDRPIEGPDDLVDYFRAGETPPTQWRVGLEHEKIALHVADASTVAYEGGDGIGALLRTLARDADWKTVNEGDVLVALDRDGESLTLEPGGQLELSGRPFRTIHETSRELSAHLEAVRAASKPAGIAWLALGAQPFHATADLPRMPKGRYRIMRQYLPSRGALAMDMMHATASVQASFDYADEADMTAKLRTALGVTSIVSAIFANSSLHEGRPSGFVSRRMEIWRHTDPARCGGIPFVFDEDFGYARYAEWALDVPMFFLVRDGAYTPLHGLTFRGFLCEGFEGRRATLADFDRHLTTLFPDVRLKRLIEVRGADSVAEDLVCAVPALWKGLLYDGEARSAAWALVASWSPGAREEAYRAVSRTGLSARAAGRPVLEWARELVEIAREGLRRIAHRDAAGRDERIHLDPVLAILEGGRSPGEIVAERWEGEWQRSPERLIASARY